MCSDVEQGKDLDHGSLLTAMALAGAAGLAMPLGATLAMQERLHRRLSRRFHHGVIAFGGGALLSAVALVLVPQGAEEVPPLAALAFFLAGGLAFFGIDRAVARSGGSGAQLLAMLLDYLPEAAALGALLAVDRATALLLAAMIFLQNLPEGFSAYREIRVGSHVRPGRVVALFLALALVGPIAAAIGMLALSGRPHVLGAIMLFAAGGILYLIFEDIAPVARTEGDWAPPLGAVFGFALGLGGHLMLH